MGMSALEAVRQQRHAAGAHRMRRCFMTGKDCIYRPAEADTAAGETKLTAFVVMPYKPNLDTVYEWSLKPYLEKKDLNVERADQFSKMGYVVCEHICRRIQDADIVAVDLSVDNTNCFYELGLAVGLGKHLLVLCDDAAYDKVPHHWAALGITSVLRYPNVGFIGDAGEPLDQFVEPVPLESRTLEMRIVSILVDEPPIAPQPADPQGIPISFTQAVHAAVGVGISRMEGNRAKRPALDAALEALGEDPLRRLKNCHEERNVVLLQRHGGGPTFAEAGGKINSAFACIIDLLDEHPLSYFWLGYCHARGINAIPIDRGSGHQGAATEDHMLAFNIRALWYMQYREDRPAGLADALGNVVEELIIKDVPSQQRRIFWERLTRKPQVHIYTGAVHHDRLGREVVGDWDLRTVSELVRHLSSTAESAVPRLEEPIYAPEEIDPNLDLLTQYTQMVADELAGKNCLVVASSDVNPITEVVLARASRSKRDWQQYCFSAWADGKKSATGTVVALKGEDTDASAGTRRHFSLPTHDGLNAKHRGFLLDGEQVIQREYKSQNDPKPEFSVLSHLMVVQNPFSLPPHDDIIVLLNGVSGPGTFGVAELLTGGTTDEKGRDAEKLLRVLNKTWDDMRPGREGFGGIEAFVEVMIKPGPTQGSPAVGEGEEQAAAPTAASGQQPRMKLSDDRQVVSWCLVEESTELPRQNPRSLPL